MGIFAPFRMVMVLPTCLNKYMNRKHCLVVKKLSVEVGKWPLFVALALQSIFENCPKLLLSRPAHRLNCAGWFVVPRSWNMEKIAYIRIPLYYCLPGASLSSFLSLVILGAMTIWLAFMWNGKITLYSRMTIYGKVLLVCLRGCQLNKTYLHNQDEGLMLCPCTRHQGVLTNKRGAIQTFWPCRSGRERPWLSSVERTIPLPPSLLPSLLISDPRLQGKVDGGL